MYCLFVVVLCVFVSVGVECAVFGLGFAVFGFGCLVFGCCVCVPAGHWCLVFVFGCWLLYYWLLASRVGLRVSVYCLMCGCCCVGVVIGVTSLFACCRCCSLWS